MTPNQTPAYAYRLVASRGLASLGAIFTTFSLDVWVYKSTGSYPIYAFIAAAIALPPLLLSPAAGFLADRHSKAKILCISEVVTLLTLGVLAALHQRHALMPLHVGIGAFALSAINEFRYTALQALIPEISPPTAFIRLNSIQQMFRGLSLISGPLLGALAYEYMHLATALLLAAGTNLYALAVTSRIWRHRCGAGEPAAGKKSFIQEYAQCLKWLSKQPGLKRTLIYFSALTAALALFGTLTMPHLLETNNVTLLASVMAAQGCGMILGGILLSRSKKSLRADQSMLAGAFGLGMGMVVFGIANAPLLLLTTSTLVGATISVAAAANQTMWQHHTPQSMQGKMTAIRSMAIYALTPASIWLSAFLASAVPLAGASVGPTPPIPATQWPGTTQAALGLAIIVAGAIWFYTTRGKFDLHHNHSGRTNENQEASTIHEGFK